MSSQFYWYFYSIIINWSRFLKRFYFTINLGKIDLKRKKKNWEKNRIEKSKLSNKPTDRKQEYVY